MSGEVLEALDVMGGLLLEMRKSLDEQQQVTRALSEDVADAVTLAKKSHAGMLTLTEQVEQLSGAMGVSVPTASAPSRSTPSCRR